MTDLEKFIDTYKQFGIEVEAKEEDDKLTITLGNGTGVESEKFEGYSFFHTQLIFTKEGKFISQGFWE